MGDRSGRVSSPAGAPALDEELAPYNDEQRAAFEAHYRDALERFGDEERAREIAHAAARGTPGDR